MALQWGMLNSVPHYIILELQKLNHIKLDLLLEKPQPARPFRYICEVCCFTTDDVLLVGSKVTSLVHWLIQKLLPSVNIL